MQDAFSERKMLKYFVGVCLYLSKKRSELEAYDCRGFRCGCPEKTYWSYSIYRCKHDILSLYQLNAFFLRMISIKDVIDLTVFGTLETSLLYMLFMIN